MELTPEERALKERFDRHLATEEFQYYPDGRVVARVLKQLAKRQEELGEPYCPCRLVTGKPEADRNIICPCAYHRKEIEQHGHCLCRLFAARDFRPDA